MADRAPRGLERHAVPAGKTGILHEPGKTTMANATAATRSRKDAATGFRQLVVSGKIRETYAAYVREDMRHHNPAFAGDASSLKKAIEQNHVMFPNKVFKPKHVIEEGDYVVVHSHILLKPGDPGIAAVHIFRFEGDRIAELWDIGQPVPKETPNTGGMF